MLCLSIVEMWMALLCSVLSSMWGYTTRCLQSEQKVTVQSDQRA